MGSKTGYLTLLLTIGWVVLMGGDAIIGTGATSSRPAFPGAEGFGTHTPGGRGGQLLQVTNLNDAGHGSLRAALEATGSRIVVFRGGGTIHLQAPIIITEPYLTLAGQTAPGDGILLRGEGLIVAAHDVVIRNIRVRIGDEGAPTHNRDGINISTTHANSDVYNVVIDHCSVSWGIDDNLSTWTWAAKPYKTYDITIQWCISSEALDHAVHVDEGDTVTSPHSMGALLGKNGRRVSFHHNLLAHNRDRNPRLAGIVHAEVVNNVIYGWGDGPAKFSSDKSVAHLLNNYFKAGPNSRPIEIQFANRVHAKSQVYISGNMVDANSKHMVEPRLLNRGRFPLSSGLLFTSSGLVAETAKKAYQKVLNQAGAVAPHRDPVDARIVANVQHRMGRIIDTQNEVNGWPIMRGGTALPDRDQDGMPDSWERGVGLDPNDSSDGNDTAPSGYTWIEEYINSKL